MTKVYGLVLTGGGARAAYQAGVLRGLAEIVGERRDISPLFQVVTGISAGAINAAYIASRGTEFKSGTEELCKIWNQLMLNQVIKTDVMSMTALGSRWIKDLSLGGVLGSSRSTFLLDTHPLRKFLSSRINFADLNSHLKNGVLRSAAFSATNYKTGTAISFFDGDPQIQEWVRSSRIGVRSPIELDHVLASASIPILFPPVKIGKSFYGDGGIRLTSPLSPAIHLGSQKILAIGIRYSRTDEYTWKINQTGEMPHISVADVAGVMLNAAFLDSLESDLERMSRINQTLELIPAAEIEKHPHRLRKIPILTIRPSQDLAGMASEQFHKFPRMLRYLMKGVGVSDQQGWDFLSYLAFDQAYTHCLLELGYDDAYTARNEIIEFFSDE